jgi:hypothetical protein
MALAASLESSDDQRPTVRIRSVLKEITNKISSTVFPSMSQSPLWLHRVERERKSSYSRDPIVVDGGKSRGSLLSLLGLEGSDKDTIGSEQVGDGSSLSKELGVGEDIKVDSRSGVGVEDGPHRLSSSARDGGLLDDDLGGGGNSSDLSSGELDVAEGGERREEGRRERSAPM